MGEQIRAKKIINCYGILKKDCFYNVRGRVKMYEGPTSRWEEMGRHSWGISRLHLSPYQPGKTTIQTNIERNEVFGELSGVIQRKISAMLDPRQRQIPKGPHQSRGDDESRGDEPENAESSLNPDDAKEDETKGNGVDQRD